MSRSRKRARRRFRRMRLGHFPLFWKRRGGKNKVWVSVCMNACMNAANTRYCSLTGKRCWPPDNEGLSVWFIHA